MIHGDTKVIGIAGPSCSGKSSLANELSTKLKSIEIAIIPIDSYYKDLTDIPMLDREQRNFDSPDAFDLDLIAMNLESIKNGHETEIPIYDYKTHARSDKSRKIEPSDIVIIDGILIFYLEAIRSLLDFKIFIDIDQELALKRRIDRDFHERQRTEDSVRQQYADTVLPMYEKYIKPSQEYANIILDGGRSVNSLFELIQTVLKAKSII